MHKIYKQFSLKFINYALLGIVLQSFVFAPVFASGAKGEISTNLYHSEGGDIAREAVTVTGTVTFSEDGTTMPGVNVVIKGTTIGTTTDSDGKYTLSVPDENSILTFSFIGYVRQEIEVGVQSVIDVAMVPDLQQLGEVVVVGYGMQEKVTLTGSVSSIKGDEMLRTKNENPQNMLTGRVAGVRVWQKSAEPGTFNASFDIRGLGSPLVVIDGIQRTMGDFQRLNPSDIENLSVLKDASAAIYGARAANGVVLVTTKKGTTSGRAKVVYNGSYTLQTPSGFPELADPYQTMTLYNEMAMNNINGGNLIYQESDFEAFRTGERRTTDWNSLLINEYSPQSQHDISITGGTDKTQYYIAGGYLYQEGFFKSGDMNYSKFNLRSNITTELAKGLKFNLNLSGVADERNSPYSSAVDIIRNYWRQGVLFPAYADPEGTMLNYEGLDLEQNTVAMMRSDVSGYRQYRQKYFQSSASLDYDLGTVSHVLEGLTAKGLISFDYRSDDNDIYRREYYQYMYDPLSDSYLSKLYNNSSPNQIRREIYSKQQILGQFLLNYKRKFGTNHNVTGLLGFETQTRKGDNLYAQRDLAFAMKYLVGGMNENQQGGMQGGSGDLYEIANSAMFGRLNYTFADRYIAEVQFRYDGSSKFVKTNRWGWFPSASLGWRVSEEDFFKSVPALSFVDQLKFRASYGMTADDGSLAYDWYPGYIYPATSGNAQQGYYNQYAPGYMLGGEFVYGASVVVPNENITWWTAKTFDVGVDFEAWRGMFGFSLDYFDRRRDGLFSNRSGDIPTVVGTGAPRENTNSDRQYGMDLEVSHRNTIGLFSYGLKGIATITRRQHLIAAEKGPWGNSYDQWRNDNLTDRYQGVQFGYESAGRYEDWEDIWSFPIYKDRGILPGNYKYEDWNGDGEINGLDQHPFAYDQTPWLNFSLAFDAAYKNFDLSMLFQGSALGSMEYQEPLYSIWGSNGGGALEQYLDRWHPVDPLADPYDPATEWVSGYYGYTGNYPFGNSDFNRVSTNYLRLKSIELGYTLKPQKSPTTSIRFFANAYNLLTFTGVKFVDPEHPGDELGRMYPLTKTYTVGITAQF